MAELRLCPWFMTQSPEIFSFIYFLFFWPHCVAYGISVPRPGIEPTPLAVELWCPNHWTAREFPGISWQFSREEKKFFLEDSETLL